MGAGPAAWGPGGGRPVPPGWAGGRTSPSTAAPPSASTRSNHSPAGTPTRSPATARAAAGTPVSALQPIRASATEPASGPTVSSDQDSGNTPAVSTRPKDGRNPTTPPSAAGIPTDPPGSVPRASGTRPAATAAAEPALDPPAMRRGSRGVAAGPFAATSAVRP